MASGSRPTGARAASSYFPKGTLVQVTWLDASFDLDTEPPLYTLRTNGFVIRHNKELICIASEGDGAYFRSFTAIPAGMIVKVQALKAE